MSEDEQIAATMDPEWDCPHPGECTDDSSCPCFDHQPSRGKFRRYGQCDCMMSALCPCREYSSRRTAKQAGH